MRKIRAVVLLSAVMVAAPARSQAASGWEALGDAIGTAVLIIMADSLVIASGVTTGVGNTVALAQKKRRAGWATAGFFAGGLNAAAGGVFAVWGATDLTKNAGLFGFGLAQFMLGGFNILLGVLNRNQSESPVARVSLAPLVSPFDANARVAGLALTFR